jgi:hypothetical protein
VSDGIDLTRHNGRCGVTEATIDGSGNDAFFETGGALVPQDSDTQRDFYDARSDGGFPGGTLAGACEGELCRAPFAAPPSLGPVTSSAAVGDGNLAAGPVATVITKPPVKKLTRAQRLAKALRVCRTKHNKKRRRRCEVQRRREFRAHPAEKRGNR